MVFAILYFKDTFHFNFSIKWHYLSVLFTFNHHAEYQCILIFINLINHLRERWGKPKSTCNIIKLPVN